MPATARAAAPDEPDVPAPTAPVDPDDEAFKARERIPDRPDGWPGGKPLSGLRGSASAAATPDPPQSDAAVLLQSIPATDATLASLALNGSQTWPMSPGYRPEARFYQVFTVDDTATLQVPPSAAGASVDASLNGAPVAVSNDEVALQLARGANTVVLTVTAPDTTTTRTYQLTIWQDAAPSPQIIDISRTSTSVIGGGRSTITVKNAPSLEHCWPAWVAVGGQSAYVVDNTPDPDTGVYRMLVDLPAAVDLKPGTADLSVYTFCSYYADQYQGGSTSRDAITYTPAYSVDSIEAPATITSGTPITVRGQGVMAGGALRYWLSDARGRSMELRTWTYDGENQATVYADLPLWRREPWDGDGPRTINVGFCPDGQYSSQDVSAQGGGSRDVCTVLRSKQVTWTAPVPSDLTISPQAGPMAGGTRITLRGRNMVCGDCYTEIDFGDQKIYEWPNTSHLESKDARTYFQGLETLQFNAPPSAKPGPVKVTVYNSVGKATAGASFTYVAKPAITSVAPATVAHSGGSVITLTGSNFGTTGTPTVIIGGVKSPSVTRVSDTQVTAIVPVLSGTGPADVQVSSSQGGGISAPVTLTLTAPGTLPVISSVSPASGAPGDSVTISGSGFGPQGTAGVSVGGVYAKVTASSATSLTVQIPAVDTTGAKDVRVGAITGATTSAGAVTVSPDNGIASVTPSAIGSGATGNAARITITGGGFGATGTVKVGSASPVSYTSTNGGTTIAGITVPTTTAGALTVTVTPAGATTPYKSTVRVIGPSIAYLGADPYDEVYINADPNRERSGGVLTVPLAGGTRVRVQGAGFGATGVLKVDGATVATTSWSDTAITFAAPPATVAGAETVTITPTGSSLTATRAVGLRYIGALARPSITRITANPALGHDHGDQFSPGTDPTDTFTLTGSDLTGATAVKVYAGTGTDNPVTVTPTAVTAGSLTFAAPRSISDPGWKRVEVITPGGSAYEAQGLEYLATPGVTLAVSPTYGSCEKTAQAGSGNATWNPATVTVSNDAAAFGSATGTVTVGGTAVTPTSWTATAITFGMADLTTSLTDPWGAKTIVVDPADNGLDNQMISFTCAVSPTVTTTVNGGTAHVTVPAGTAFTPGYTHTGFVGTNAFTVTTPAGYEYSPSENFDSDVRAGVPAAAGDWWVRVNRNAATYARERYVWTQNPSPVRVTITGTPITITPSGKNGPSFTYKGQLTGGDFLYTPSVTTDPITAVTWEHRNSTCGSEDWAWQSGLPKNVAWGECGADHTQQAAWDVRVASFEMKTSGTDRAIYYAATRPTTRITINPRTLTVTAVRADKVYDGTTTAAFSDPVFTGRIGDDEVALDSGGAGATYASPAPGTGKTVTLTGDLALTGNAARNYTLANPRPTLKGTITKAGAVLTGSVNPTAILISANPDATATVTVSDTRGGAPFDGAGLADVVLTSATPAICTVTGTTITGKTAGRCIIHASQAESANYRAAVAAGDPESAIEKIELPVFAAAQSISVVADDLTIAQGETPAPTAQIGGLFDGDSVGGVEFDYYDGTSPLGGAPIEPGTYTVVPKGGSLQDGADTSRYGNAGNFAYVTGTLVITPTPPTITRISPTVTYVPGGTQVTVTGTLLGAVRTVRFGEVTIKAPDFSVNDEGTELTFTAPPSATAKTVPITLLTGAAEATSTFSYVALPAVVVPEPPAPIEPSPSPSPSPTVTPPVVVPPDAPTTTPTPTQTPAPTPSPTATPTPTGTPSAGPTTSPTPGPTSSPNPSPAPTDPTPDAPVRLNLDLRLDVDTPLVGAKAQLTGGGLQPASDYVLTMQSTPIVVATGETDGNGDFTAIITMPGKACVSAGLHQLILSGTAPNGTRISDTNWITLNDTCTATSIHTTKPVGNTVTMRSFIFPYQSAKLRPDAKKTLRGLAGSLKGAKVVTITGYTQTDKKSKAAIRANKKLGKQRANAVRKYLRSLGVNVTIVTVGAGPVNPVDKRKQKRNRRVTIVARF
ncbi:IPT/TIG domain-containing protein [Catenuloplanes nepalensis]|uniref:IPT/TIG domain-containing protein n=1 Tax=Catenuloplanes nepalensis TaxID=587533 RepID=UPI0027D80688|nr:IPT/TIG domain-containing protein [Catenuloplanes nepalensis]